MEDNPQDPTRVYGISDLLDDAQTDDESGTDTPDPAEPDSPGGLTGTNIVLILSLAVLLVAAGALAYYLVPRFLIDYDEPGMAASGSEAVQEYLEALSIGDAATALLYSAAQPAADPVFTSNDFLKQSLRTNPLTGINVPDGQSTSSPAQIQATYTLGGQKVSAHFTVQQHDRTWLLDGGFLPLNLTALQDKGQPLTLGGVSLGNTATADLFPGVYTLATTNPMLALTNPDLRIEYPESNPTFSESFLLSDEGVSRIQQAAKAQLDKCLTQQELQPEGCGFGFIGSGVGTVDPATITWSLPADAPDISAIDPTLDVGSLNMAVANTSVTVNFHAISTDKKHLYDDTSTITGVRADFTDPDNIKVTFGVFG